MCIKMFLIVGKKDGFPREEDWGHWKPECCSCQGQEQQACDMAMESVLR